MRDKKWRFELYSIWDHTGLEAHLARMAEKGWLLEKISNFGWTYRRIEPQKLTFCVTYYPKASDFASEISEGQETFYAFCQHTGWELAASWAQLQVFCNKREDPIPIETDPLLELDTIHRTVKRTTLLSNSLLAVLALLNGGLIISRLRRDSIGLLSSSSTLFSCVCWVTVLLLTVSEVTGYYRWRAKAQKAAERGEFLATNSRIKLQVGCLVFVGVGLLYYILSVFTSGDLVIMTIAPLMFLGIGLLFFLGNAIKKLLKRKKVSANVNRVVTIVSIFILSYALVGGITFGMLAGMQKGWFAGDRGTYQYHGHVFVIYDDELPLTMEALTGETYGADVYTREWRDSASLLLAQYEAHQHPRFDRENYVDLPRLDYTVTLVKVPALYGLCRDSLLAEYDGSGEYWAGRAYVPQDPAPWGAEEVFRVMDPDGPWDIWLLCYPDRFVDFRPSWELTEEQMALAGAQLGGV